MRRAFRASCRGLGQLTLFTAMAIASLSPRAVLAVVTPDVPRRLLTEMLANEQHSPTPSLPIPLDAAWTTADGTLEQSSTGLHFTPATASTSIDLAVVISTGPYNQARVTMKVDYGDLADFAWRNAAGSITHVQVPVVPGRSYEYTFPLKATLWHGQITDLYITPSNAAAHAIIYAVNLEYSRPPTPAQVTIHGVTMDASPGPLEWTLTVPRHSQFEVWYGLSGNGLDAQSSSARFTILLSRDHGPPKTLLNEELSPVAHNEDARWRRFNLDLSPFAGEAVTLKLNSTIDSLSGDEFAYWGNPKIYGNGASSPSVPVILISCDTLRADHLSCFGYSRQTSPHLDAWVNKDAVMFQQAITPGAYTLISHMTMMTGLYPKNHATTEYVNLSDTIATLPQTLRAAGYLTAGFTGQNWWFAPQRGFGRGFDYYDIPYRLIRTIDNTFPLVAEWLAQHTLKRQFLFFHNYDIHYKPPINEWLPYDPANSSFHHFSRQYLKPGMFKGDSLKAVIGTNLPEAEMEGRASFTPEEHNALVALYDDCIQLVDQRIADLFTLLKERQLYEDALIIVTADHGETLHERGYYGHQSVNEEVCRVPLMIKFPQQKYGGQKVNAQVDLTSLFPTIVEVAGLPPVMGLDGKSLVPLLQSDSVPEQITYIERDLERPYAVRTPNWKLHHNVAGDQWELYNLQNDPEESANVLKAAGEIGAKLRQRFNDFFAPRNSGWNLKITPGTAPAPCEIYLNSATNILSVWQIMDNGQFRLLPGAVANSRKVKINSNIAMHLIVKTTDRSPLRVSVKSPSPVSLVAEGASDVTSATDPSQVFIAEESKAFQAAQPPANGAATIVVSYAGVPLGTSADAPSAETQEQMKSIGYF